MLCCIMSGLTCAILRSLRVDVGSCNPSALFGARAEDLHAHIRPAQELTSGHVVSGVIPVGAKCMPAGRSGDFFNSDISRPIHALLLAVPLCVSVGVVQTC